MVSTACVLGIFLFGSNSTEGVPLTLPQDQQPKHVLSPDDSSMHSNPSPVSVGSSMRGDFLSVGCSICLGQL